MFEAILNQRPTRSAAIACAAIGLICPGFFFIVVFAPSFFKEADALRLLIASIGVSFLPFALPLIGIQTLHIVLSKTGKNASFLAALPYAAVFALLLTGYICVPQLNARHPVLLKAAFDLTTSTGLLMVILVVVAAISAVIQHVVEQRRKPVSTQLQSDTQESVQE